MERWLATHDPEYHALRRAARAALLMPAMLALGDKAIGDPTVALFAAFGSFAMLLLVDFSGSIKDRVFDQAALGLAGAVFICIGTLASQTTWTAAAAMAVVAFAVLFAGIVSSVLASATTALLLSFILSVSVRGDASSIPDRLAGWGLAAASAVLAVALLWPAPARNPVRVAAIAACRALATRLRAAITVVKASGSDVTIAQQEHRAAVSRSDAAVQTLQDRFFATPYSPSVLSSEARAVIKLVDQLRTLNQIVLRSPPSPHQVAGDDHACSVKAAAANVLDPAADLLENPLRSRGFLSDAVEAMQAAVVELEAATLCFAPRVASDVTAGESNGSAVISSLDPGFRAQELAFLVAEIAASAELAARAEQRSWLDRLIGRGMEARLSDRFSAAQRRAGAHVERTSLWLHNSLRGAIALGLAVLVAELSSVQHSFWVALGTLSVLRSSALSTGQSAARALVGTALGFLAGGALVYLIGSDENLLWAFLPPVVLLAGLAPAAISFVAGQAAFTLTILILFNIIAPAGWKIGLVRIEDVALGGAVSLLVGLLFWPRGAGPALGRALARAYEESARYLAAAVAYGVDCCDFSPSRSAHPGQQALGAVAADARLDDAFREYLAERGSKPAPLAEISELLTGAAGLRLAGDAVMGLWSDSNASNRGDRAAARRELLSSTSRTTDWYARFAASLAGDGDGDVPAPLAADSTANERLVDAVERDLKDPDGRATATGVRVIWTGDHVDAARRLQASLVEPARAVVT